jgi:hypothetical protein
VAEYTGIGVSRPSRIGTRKTLIVALARKLVIALWRFVTTGERRLMSSELKVAHRTEDPTQHHPALALVFRWSPKRRSEVAGAVFKHGTDMPT